MCNCFGKSNKKKMQLDISKEAYQPADEPVVVLDCHDKNDPLAEDRRFSHPAASNSHEVHMISHNDSTHYQQQELHVSNGHHNNQILELTEAEIKEYREAFEMFDKNKDGTITKDEIRASIEACGLQATEGEVQQILKETDRDGSGTIEWDEFLKAMIATKRRMSLSDNNYLEAFNVFDVDKDGEISRKELISAIDKLGLGFIYTREVIDRMFSLADANRDGKISRNEFVAAMKKGI